MARNWWVLLVNGLLLVTAGVLIFGIDWSVRSLSVFIGALFIFEGISLALVRGLDRTASRTNVVSGLDRTASRTNVVSGLASVAAGIAIVVWPRPGLTAVAIFLGAWLIVMGTLTISGSFAARRVLPDWWLWLILGLLEVPLGVLALADPGTTLAALITVAGIWAVVIGVMRIVLAFELKRLPDRLEELESGSMSNGASTTNGYPRAAQPELGRHSSGATA